MARGAGGRAGGGATTLHIAARPWAPRASGARSAMHEGVRGHDP
jgi:hypothetical protein